MHAFQNQENYENYVVLVFAVYLTICYCCNAKWRRQDFGVKGHESDRK